jgi:DNA-binding PadR family transcriptional regulator
MSYTKKRTNINGLETKYKILASLAQKQELSQYDMPKIFGVKYRQVIRIIHELRDHDLIFLKRTEQSEKGGKPKNIWSITFYGIMEVLQFLNNQQINRVANLHRDKWIIFSELPFLLNRLGKYKEIFYVILRQLGIRFDSLLSDLIKPFDKKQIKQMGYTLKEWATIEKRFEKHVLEQTKQSCTNTILALEFFNNPIPYVLNEEAQEWDEKTRKSILQENKRKLMGLSKNEPIKRHIIKQFKNAEKAFNYLELLKNF